MQSYVPVGTKESLRLSRRSFLRTGFLAGASVLASSRRVETAVSEASGFNLELRRRTDKDATVLIVIQLSGGNDGLNTVIPYIDDAYFASRPSLAIPAAKALKLNDHLALHGMLAGLRELYDSGELAVILGVGYPNLSRSHFRSTEIWRTASDSSVLKSESWLSRSVDARCTFKWEALLRMTRRSRPSARYPCCQLASGLDLASRFISAGTARIFCLSQGGYDTHSGQLSSHQRVLKDLDNALKAFVSDLKVHGDFRRVLIMIFSEFGRRLAENHHGGTDHGSAGAMLLAGEAVRGGIYGELPSLTGLADGQLVHGVDFRSVYATVLEKWLHVPSHDVLGRKFPTLAFL